MDTVINKLLPLPVIDIETTAQKLTTETQNFFQKNNVSKAVLGLSGGIDSALALAVCVAALGKENVIAIAMPYKTSSKKSLEHAQLVAQKFDVTLDITDISPVCDAFFSTLKNDNPKRAGNIMARTRMVILYDVSARENALVMGTGNKSEILLGYSTLWGDSAYAFNPLGELYKNNVRALSRHFQVPQEIIDKPPSADLWEGQSDEQELAFTYDMADRILYHAIDLKKTTAEIEEALSQCNEDVSLAKKILKRVDTFAFKRKMPFIVSL